MQLQSNFKATSKVQMQTDIVFWLKVVSSVHPKRVIDNFIYIVSFREALLRFNDKGWCLIEITEYG